MSSLDYIVLPIDTDPIDILDDAYSYMQTNIPGWTPSDGQLDVQILQSNSSIAAESRDVASGVPRSIFRWFGATVLNIPPDDATSATSSVTFTLIDTLGHTVPAGTQIGIPDATNENVAFITTADLIVFAGQSTGTVNISALIPGADSSGIGSAALPVDLLDPLDFVSTVVLVAPTTGGVDAETDNDYLNRLSAELTLLAPRPILPADFAQFARDIPGVYRAVALDTYNPNTATYNNDRTVTIAAVDINGNPVSSTIKAAIDADLQGRRELNFQVFEVDPNIVIFTVQYTVKAIVGADLVATKSNIDAAINNFLNPATWGTVAGNPRTWVQTTTVRYLELAQAINEADGVDYISALTFGISGGTQGTADVVMSGVAPLADAGTITGTVT